MIFLHHNLLTISAFLATNVFLSCASSHSHERDIQKIETYRQAGNIDAALMVLADIARRDCPEAAEIIAAQFNLIYQEAAAKRLAQAQYYISNKDVETAKAILIDLVEGYAATPVSQRAKAMLDSLYNNQVQSLQTVKRPP